MGIEPTSEAWEALNKTLKAIDLAALSVRKKGSNWKLDGNWRRTVPGRPVISLLRRDKGDQYPYSLVVTGADFNSVMSE